MTERTYTTIDKSTWGPGSWQEEPDKIQWRDRATGLPCLVVRAPGGHWCGYVGVPPGHSAFEKDYDAVESLLPPCEEEGHLSVHGGLTYAGHCDEGPEETSICHVPEEGELDHVWWLGFDCAHSGDFSPRNHTRLVERERYRDLAYVRAETGALARQLLSPGINPERP